MQDKKNNSVKQMGYSTPYRISPDFIKSLRQKLNKSEHGSITRIAKIAGVTVQRASAALHGREYDERVYDAAIKYLEDRIKEVKEYEKRILKILES